MLLFVVFFTALRLSQQFVSHFVNLGSKQEGRSVLLGDNNTTPQVEIEPATLRSKSPMLYQLAYWCSLHECITYMYNIKHDIQLLLYEAVK